MKRLRIFSILLLLLAGLSGGYSLASVPIGTEPAPKVLALVPGKCTFCEGARDCQDCYPPGSKVGYSGEDCTACHGSGGCSYCSASGKCHLCGGAGFESGCNNCTKVLES